MPINKIAVYQGGQWITEDIAVQSSKIIGNIQSSQIESIDSSKITGSIQSSQIDSLDSSKITGLNHSASYVALAAVNTNGHLIVPSTPVLHTHLTGLTRNVQSQLDEKASITALQTSATYVGINDGNNNLSFQPFNQWYIIPLHHAATSTGTTTTRVNFQMSKDDNYQIGGLYYVQRGAHFEMGSLILSGSHTSNPSSGTQTSDSVLSTYALCTDLSNSISLNNVAGETSAQLPYARLSMRIAITGTNSASFGFMPFFARHINGDVLSISYT